MRKLQKACLLILICFLGICPLIKTAVSAAEAITIQIGEAEGKKGDRITIPISLKGEGVAGMDFTVSYDPQELVYAGGVKGESAKQGELCDINHIEERAAVHYVYIGNKAIEKNGDVLLLSFDVLQDREEKHTVDVKVKKILNSDIKELPYLIEGGRRVTLQEGSRQENPEGDANNSLKHGGAVSQDSTESGEDSALESRKADKEPKKRVVIKTKDGLKDVTDSLGKKTTENLLGEKEDRVTQDSKGNMMVIVCMAVVAVVLGGGYIIWRKRKR